MVVGSLEISFAIALKDMRLHRQSSIGIMVFSPIKEGQLHFPFPSFAQFSHRNPFVVVEHFPLGRKSDYEILATVKQSVENLVVIVSPIHNKGGLAQYDSDGVRSKKYDSPRSTPRA